MMHTAATKATRNSNNNSRRDNMSQETAMASQATASQYEAGGFGPTTVGSDFVSQCQAHADRLRERKQAQEERMEALLNESFGQIEQIFQALLQAAQANQATTQAQFEEASAQLDENLTRHRQVETKLRGIMAILLGSQGEM